MTNRNSFATAMGAIRKGEVMPFYLLYGAEPYLIRQLTTVISAIVAPDAAEGMDCNLFDGESTSLDQVLTAAMSPPWFNSRRLVVVRHCPWFAKGNADGNRPDLERCFDAIAGQGVVVFEAGESVDRRQRLYGLIATEGMVVECAQLNLRELKQWVKQRSREMELEMDGTVIEAVLAGSTRDLQGIENELLKISDYQGGKEKTVALETVVKLCGAFHGEQLFPLVEAIVAGETETAQQLLQQSFQLGIPAPRILYLLIRHYRILHRLQQSPSAPKQTVESFRIPLWAVKKYQDQARRMADRSSQTGLRRMLEFDLAMKTGREKPNEGMERLVYLLTQNNPQAGS